MLLPRGEGRDSPVIALEGPWAGAVWHGAAWRSPQRGSSTLWGRYSPERLGTPPTRALSPTPNLHSQSQSGDAIGVGSGCCQVQVYVPEVPVQYTVPSCHASPCSEICLECSPSAAKLNPSAQGKIPHHLSGEFTAACPEPRQHHCNPGLVPCILSGSWIICHFPPSAQLSSGDTRHPPVLQGFHLGPTRKKSWPTSGTPFFPQTSCL